MGNAAGSTEVPQGKEGKTASASPGSRKQSKEPKLPMPPEGELEERFGAVLVSCDFDTEERSGAEKSEECGACWKCARPQDELIAVPGTQSHIRAPLCWSLMQH